MLANPKSPATKSSTGPHRLHVGSGGARIEGWINIDMQALPGVDVVADVTGGLQFSGVEAIFAEHFLEHLKLDDAIAFLLESHRVLAPGAWIRSTTPNLDWVWLTHYKLGVEPEVKCLAALRLNRAFHGWQHQFLWNSEILQEALLACGFEQVRWCRRGESELPMFQGIERHEIYDDSPDLPHIIIVEARKGEPQPKRLSAFRDRLFDEFLNHLKG